MDDGTSPFGAKKIRSYEPIDAQGFLFEPRQTGARLHEIANQDLNRAFRLSFQTHAVDNTGMPHVFEDAALP